MITTSLVEKTVQIAKQSLVDELRADLERESKKIIEQKVSQFSDAMVSVFRKVDNDSLLIHIRVDETK